MNKKTQKALKWTAAIVASPFVMFLLLAVLIYIPPVQTFVVHKVSEAMSDSIGVSFSIDRVRLAFPLDLALHGVTARDGRDTLLDARSMRLNVCVRPLFEGRADVDGLEIHDAKLDTRSYVSDTRVRGFAETLTASAHGIDWQREIVDLDHLRLHGANFSVELSDTAKEDTTKSAAHWLVNVGKAEISRSQIAVRMPGDSMRIKANLEAVVLNKGVFDTGKNNYSLQRLTLRGSAVNYDIPHEKPTNGLDVNHLAISNLSFILDTLTYASDGSLRAALRRATLTEKCGLAVTSMSLGLCMSGDRIRVDGLNLLTPHSKITADADVDLRSMQSGNHETSTITADASIGMADVRILAGEMLDASLLKALPSAPLNVQLGAAGNIDNMRINNLVAQVPGSLKLTATGTVKNVMSDKRSGQLKVDASTQNLSFVRKMLPSSITSTVNIPDRMSANGNISFRADDYAARLLMQCAGGQLLANASANLARETYDVTASASQFPVGSFVKGMSLSPFSGTLNLKGASFDVLSPSSHLTAEADIRSFAFEKYNLSGLRLTSSLQGGKAHAEFSADNSLVTANGTLDATLGASAYDLALTTNVEQLNMLQLGVSKDTLSVGTNINLKATTNKALTACALSGSICGNHFSTPKRSAMAKDLLFDFCTSADTTTANISAGDLYLRMGAKGDIPQLSKQITKFLAVLDKQGRNKDINQEELKRYLPVLSFYLDAGQDNPLYNIARFKGYSFSSAYLNLNTDPQRGMSGDARVGALNLGSLLLDTISTHILQDSTGVQMVGLVKNYTKQNPNPLEVRAKAYLLNDGAGVELSYYDSEGDKGVDLGLEAQLGEEGINVHLYPEHPVLAYRNFTVNKDNYIMLGRDKSIRANVDLLADDGTGLKIYGEPTDSVNDITLSVNRLNLGELSTVLPYLPQLGGMLSGDIHITDNHVEKQLSAMASLEADGFSYEGTNLGQVGIEAVYLPKNGNEHHASAFISSNGEEVLACNGTYFDTDGGSYEGNAQLHDFPLQMLNAFLVGTDVSLKGIAAGDINVKGTTERPILNGTLDLDSAHIYSDVYGFDFRTDERAVEISDSRLVFDNYNLYSTGTEPLVLNGTLDMADLSAITLDFSMRANNFELINTEKKRQSMVYGKVYANYIGTLKGTVDNMSVRGKLEVLDRTDMTYILKDSPLSVDNRLDDLVQFVSFEDSTATVEVKQAAEGGFDLTLGISVSDAAQFHCNLSEDGQSYVDVEGGGDLTLRMTQSGEMRMTGRFTVGSGEMKYELPVIPLKTFELVDGSYVEFTGDVLNPTLNITAKERTKAIVTENDRQRSVSFNVGVAITQTLENMGLEFTIEAPEDLTIQNELAAMSAEQRGKTAVTLMATGMYMTDESLMSGSGFKTSNALNAFLQSEIQNIAGSALKTIDINLGVESGTSEKGTSTTDYSFQFAKRFCGNRISVIIGGKVSTGADATNSAESFINNISVEYRLDESASRYVKVFYDRDTQDPLEGQLTKTGAGLVLKRKTNRLGELFIFKKKKQAE